MSDLGNKFECFSCGAKFYDLGKPEPLCPKCGANQRDAKKHELASEANHAKRKRREDVVKVAEVPEEDLITPVGDDDFAEEEIETPEGVRDEDQEAEPEEIDDEE